MALRAFSSPYFSLGYLCYFGGSTTFGQIVRQSPRPYNRDTLVTGFSEQVLGSQVPAGVYVGSDALESDL
jgi:hypothetical protein